MHFELHHRHVPLVVCSHFTMGGCVFLRVFLFIEEARIGMTVERDAHSVCRRADSFVEALQQ